MRESRTYGSVRGIEINIYSTGLRVSTILKCMSPPNVSVGGLENNNPRLDSRQKHSGMTNSSLSAKKLQKYLAQISGHMSIYLYINLFVIV